MNILFEYIYESPQGPYVVGVCPLQADTNGPAALSYAGMGCPVGCHIKARHAPDGCPIEFRELPQEWLDARRRVAVT